MANLYNLDNKLLVGTNGEVRIGDTATVADVKLRVKQTAQQWTAQFVNTDSSVAYGISIDTSASSYGVAGTLQCYTNSGGGFIVRNDSRVGIGTTGPSVKLDVVGSGKFQPGVADGDALVTIAQTNSNAYVHAGIKINAGNTNPFYIYQSGSSNTLRFNYNSLADAGGQLVITDSGNVGIGATSPNVLLQLRSNINTIPANTDFAMRSGKSFRFLGDGDGNADYGSYIEAPTKGIITIGTRWVSGDEGGLTVNRAKVGIGRTNPHFNLQITGGNATEETVLKLDKGATSDTGGHTTILGLGTEGGSWAKAGIGFERTGSYDIGNIHFLMYPPGLNTGSVSLSDSVMTIKNNGNVGIGTTSPFSGAELDVYGDIVLMQKNWALRGNSANADFAIEELSGSSFSDANIKFYIKSGGNVGIGTNSPSEILQTNKNSAGNIVGGYFTNSQANTGAESVSLAFGLNRSGGDFVRQVKAITFGAEQQWTGTPSTVDGYLAFSTVSNETVTEGMRIRSGGEVNIGSTGNFSAGKLVIQQNQSENGGILTLQNGGTHGYYTRVLHNATSTSQAGYWHIKTNIPVGGNVMFIAKFYGYIYGSAQVLDLTHAGYAYSGTNTVINQGVQNNGNNVNSSSAYYTSANGGKVCFRVAFGAGATFSTYFAGVYMDMAFPSPAGQGHDFEIEAQSFSQNTTVY